MSPLLWILIAVLVIAAIAGGITISPFLLILIWQYFDAPKPIRTSKAGCKIWL